MTKNRSQLYNGSNLNYMVVLDLSCNQLIGEIPPKIGELQKFVDSTCLTIGEQNCKMAELFFLKLRERNSYQSCSSSDTSLCNERF